ncbi:MAG: PDZ domain-containing protein [Myxococcales bacterium]|nr:MAG: PDZ domain-containing protein [Myxococcales bacterium]
MPVRRVVMRGRIGIAILSVVLAIVAAFGCQRRDTLAEPWLKDKPPDESPAAAPPAQPAPLPVPEIQPPAAPPIVAEAAPPPPATPPAIAPNQAAAQWDYSGCVEKARPLFGQFKIGEQTVPWLRLGGLALAKEAGAGISEVSDPKTGLIFTRLGPLTDTGLALYRPAAPWSQPAGVEVCSTALQLGEGILFVGFAAGRPAALLARVASLPDAPPPGSSLRGAERFALFDAPLVAAFAPAIGLDEKGCLAAVAVGADASGLLTALSPEEARLLSGSEADAAARYGLPLPGSPSPSAAVPAEAPLTASPLGVARASETLRLGLIVQALTPRLAEAFGLPATQTGALVTKVQENSPAASAGLAEGDVLVSLNGRSIGKLSDLPPILAGAQAGKALALNLLREGRPLTVALVPSAR